MGFAAQAFAAHAVWMNAVQLIVPAAATYVALRRLFAPKLGVSGRRAWSGFSLAGARP